MQIKPLQDINRTVLVPADKSISHRALILSSLCRARTIIRPFLHSQDTLTTLDCMKKIGVKTLLRNDMLIVNGTGMYFDVKNKVRLYAGESGTTMRILSGLFCPQRFCIQFCAAPSLGRRPMGRIVEPLRKMGANISGIQNDNGIFAPITIKPAEAISGGTFKLAVASAQVKSAIALAGLYANTPTIIVEPARSRDHTERMLNIFGAGVMTSGKTITVRPVKQLRSPKKIFIPGDFSSAAFFIVLGLILNNSRLLIKNVNTNPTRLGLFRVLKRMGARLRLSEQRDDYEPYADIQVQTSCLKGIVVKSDEIPTMIDEIPILCVAAAFASGRTVIHGVQELKIKETDRAKSMIYNLRKAGVDIFLSGSGTHATLTINGAGNFRSADFKSFGDHRTAMSMIVFGMALDQPSAIDDITCIDKSFPEFVSTIKTFYSAPKNRIGRIRK